MLERINVKKFHVLRVAMLSLLVAGLLINSACGLFRPSKRVQVPQLLSPLADAHKDRLIQEVNRLSTTRSIHGRIDIQFEDTSFAAQGLADKYRQVDGTITMQRPGRIYLVIQFSFVDLVEMASDGQHFAVAVFQGDEKYKRFVRGTNNAVYQKLEPQNQPTKTKDGKKSEKETVSALSNLRPQHLTDALMIRPIDSAAGNIYAQSEYFQEEPDTRVEAKKDARVLRGYYLLEELAPPTTNEARVLRRFWFDRVNGIRLARIQTYDDRGLLVTDVSYFNERTFGESTTASLPSRVVLTRPQDQYKLSISYQEPTAVQLNKEYRPEVFVLQNKRQLPEVDLDAQNKKITANQ
ncbi:MAG TPA: hypothetical protein VLA93_11680 [Pyrinomonadaceae bacterium]|nr:hypothetical protein [Pyrinomonadaceae bacterium]